RAHEAWAPGRIDLARSLGPSGPVEHLRHPRSSTGSHHSDPGPRETRAQDVVPMWRAANEQPVRRSHRRGVADVLPDDDPPVTPADAVETRVMEQRPPTRHGATVPLRVAGKGCGKTKRTEPVPVPVRVDETKHGSLGMRDPR